MRVKDAVGRFGEQCAADYLQRAGMIVLARNWRCPDGELDLVVRDGDMVVFVEVKTRSSTRYGEPAEAVTRLKAARVRRLAVRWLAEHPGYDVQLRFDVVSVLRHRGGGGVELRHLRGVF